MSHMNHIKRLTLLRALMALLGAGVLALVFHAYLQPGFIVDIANRLLLCL